MLATVKLISLQNVSYSFSGRAEQALSNINLEIQGGLTVGIIGESGSGKSTLVDAILGLLEVQEGHIRLNGEDIEENIRAWQQHIGYVPQSVYLLDDTLRSNIAFGVPDEDIDEDAVQRAVHAAQLDQFVKSLTDGLGTNIGERGDRISGGQRQRIGIARALYHDPPILILDEATSALDVKTEAGVMQAVHALHGKKTIFIIAHRLSTVERCDLVVRLQDGFVAEAGSFDEVVGQSSADMDN
jgi:ABC-type multidrug transport system fused ATPase/permease subunit